MQHDSCCCSQGIREADRQAPGCWCLISGAPCALPRVLLSHPCRPFPEPEYRVTPAHASPMCRLCRLCHLCCPCHLCCSVLRCDVNGRVVMKAFLSGMPDVKLGLNEKIEVRVGWLAAVVVGGAEGKRIEERVGLLEWLLVGWRGRGLRCVWGGWEWLLVGCWRRVSV